MGSLRKKIGLKYSQIFGSLSLIIMFFAMALMLEYVIILKKVSTDISVYVQYLVYIFALFGFIFLIIFYIKYKMNEPISLYEKGIFMKRKKVSIMYNEISTFSFKPASDNTPKTLTVEKLNGDIFSFETSYVGKDFIDYFQKDYILNFTATEVEKIMHGYNVTFGVMSKPKGVFSFINPKSENFSNEFTISKDFFKYEGNEYRWQDILASYDIRTGNIEIVEKDTNNVILNTYFTYVEKGEFAFNIIDVLVDEALEEYKETEVVQDDNSIEL